VVWNSRVQESVEDYGRLWVQETDGRVYNAFPFSSLIINQSDQYNLATEPSVNTRRPLLPLVYKISSRTFVSSATPKIHTVQQNAPLHLAASIGRTDGPPSQLETISPKLVPPGLLRLYSGDRRVIDDFYEPVATLVVEEETHKELKSFIQQVLTLLRFIFT
jgi:hypothetical protein